jgi:hypothetical protein
MMLVGAFLDRRAVNGPRHGEPHRISALMYFTATHLLMVKRIFLAFISVAALLATPAQAAPPDAPVSSAAVEAIGRFLEICGRGGDIELRGREVVAAGLVHPSKLDPGNPSQLNADALRFSFKRAVANAHFYEPRITRVVETSTTGIGFGATAQAGRIHKYFVAKRVGAAGMPAPIHVFFPQDGASPVLYDWGSL